MDLNLALFHWVAAGQTPNPLVLPVAKLLAVYGPWLVVAVMAWQAWRRPALRSYFFVLLVLAGCTSLLAHAIAGALQMPRPFMLGLGQQFIEHSGRGAMPSTHAAVMSLVVAGFALRPELRKGWPALALATLATCWGRIYVNVHFPFDVLGGMVLGALVMLAAWGAAAAYRAAVDALRPGKARVPLRPSTVA